MGSAANSQQLLQISSLIKENPDLCLERRRRRRQLLRHRHSFSSSSSSSPSPSPSPNGINGRYYYNYFTTSSIVMKRRARLDRCVIRPLRNINVAGVERKVRILKKLVPNSESMGVERVLRETADYIVALQIRVQVMKIMVDVLMSSSSANSHDDDDDDDDY